MEEVTSIQDSTPSETLSTPSTKALLTCGVVAGPVYVILGLLQVVMRDGFDLTRHPLSVLSNGDWGWIQVANFVVSGLLVIASAIGIRRALHPGRGGTWGPLRLGVYGLGLVGAGVFSADPFDGFPPGTPAGRPGTVSTNGLRHFVAGGLGFFGLIAACFVFARRFAALKRLGWAAYSAATGLLFFAAFFGIASGSGKAWLNVTFGIAVLLIWAWISAIAALLLSETGSAGFVGPEDFGQRGKQN